MAYSESDPSALVYRARMQAGLTQGEVAHRARISRQMVSAYERGLRHPSIATLETLLGGCGVRLRLELVPEPGLEDKPTRDLLSLPPLQRLLPPQQNVLIRLADMSATADQMLLAGKAGARLQGADIGVPELEMVVNPTCPPEQIAALLNEAGAEYLDSTGAAAPVCLTRERLRAGCWLVLDDVDVQVRSFEHYKGMQERAGSIPLLSSLSMWVASSSDCSANWLPRDLDRLAVQRAWRLIGEAA